MFIAGLGTAAPPRRYTQRECWEALPGTQPFERLNSRSQALLRKVLLGRNGIGSRHLALERLEDAFDLRPDTLHARFAAQAPALATQAAQRALADAQCTAGQIDALLVSTCTGYLCPGLTSYLSEGLGLRPEVLALDLVGQGCAAALPSLRTAEALLQAGRAGRVLSICVEICSAAFYLDDDPGVLISACLFGDGAGAAVLSLEPPGSRRLEWRTPGSRLCPQERESLRFEQRAGLLRNILTPQVPALAGRQAAGLLSEVLLQTQVGRDRIKGWVLHPGGREVLTALRQNLGLDQADLRWSAAVLEEYGNLSSASVYFVLETALSDSPPEGYWWMSAFGAGFACHGALLHYAHEAAGQ